MMNAQRTGNIMSHWTVRHLRMHCASPNARPTIGRDGVVAVAGVNERAGLARLLLVDMGLWKRNDGASVTNAIDVLATEAHRRLIAGFTIGRIGISNGLWPASGLPLASGKPD